MIFCRAGEIELSGIVLCNSQDRADSTVLPFRLINLDVLDRARFCDTVIKASVYIFTTYEVRIECTMQNGNIVEMSGYCSPSEYKSLNDKYWEEEQ